MLIVIVVLALPLIPTFWAILDIPKRSFPSGKKKILWFMVVATLPFIGAVFYIIVGRRGTQPLESTSRQDGSAG